MNYLTESDIKEISNNVRLLSIDEIDDISHYSYILLIIMIINLAANLYSYIKT